jgi:hypothetical protein
MNIRVNTRVTVEMFQLGKGNVTGALSLDEITEMITAVFWKVIVPSRVHHRPVPMEAPPDSDDIDLDFDPEDVGHRATANASASCGVRGDLYSEFDGIDVTDINNIEDLLGVLRKDGSGATGKGSIGDADIADIDRLIAEAGGWD